MQSLQAARSLLLITAITVATMSNAHGAKLGAPLLIAALQQGGYVLYLRHAKTSRSSADQLPIDFNSCDRQRNLSNAGRLQAKTIAATFRKFRVSFSVAVSSPYCRCLETAKLIVGDTVHAEAGLAHAIAQSREVRAAGRRRLQSLLSQRVQTGNRLIVGHTSNLQEAAGIWPEEEGEAWVFRPLGDGGYESLGRLRAYALK